MSNRIFTVAILGVGARGADVYGRIMANQPDKFKIVSLCDLREERLSVFGKEFGVSEDNRFTNEESFFERKRADALIIATQDADHVRHAIRAFELGYDVLLEKPITDSEKECKRLLAAQKKYNRKALVCHVLRYAPAFVKSFELIEKGEIGRLVCIDALERVGYWHQAHSFVRGNWRSTDYTAPMILAKCCHDLDLLQYYAKSKCKSISSVGDLTYFTSENAPEGAADQCVSCKHSDSCPYSAKKIYIDMWKENGSPEDTWPYNIIAQAPLDEDKLLHSIKTTPYGRCVYRCDNNVVDHEITEINFENGVKANLTMTAFTYRGGRRLHFFGTLGELILEEENDTLTLNRFGKESEVIDISIKNTGGYSHGGGDINLILEFYDVLCGKENASTSLEASLESHLMGIYAEKSRLRCGKKYSVH